MKLTRKSFLAALAAPFLARFFPKPKYTFNITRINGQKFVSSDYQDRNRIDWTDRQRWALGQFDAAYEEMRRFYNLQRDQIELAINPPAV